jgi:4-amino-4-deoxy-L-arabinose transferase-like glycosyltransferase
VARATDQPARWFWGAVALVTVVGLGVRIGYAVEWRVDRPLGGDALFYHGAANLLTTGRGFVNPYVFVGDGVLQQAADHPPLQTVYLALWSFVGLRSQLAHVYAGVVLGTLSIVIGALAGRAAGGARVGVLAALLLALYPNVWRHDALVMAETPAVFATLLTIWFAYRYLARPSVWRLVAVGAAIGMAALARSELVLLSVFVVVPLALLAHDHPIRQRVGWLAASAAACFVVLAPWTVANLLRFDHPVLLSSQAELTFATANCESTYYGPLIGYWDLGCADRVLDENDLRSQDPEAAAVLRDVGTTYVRENLGAVPRVMAARVGRMVGLYRPGQQADIDAYVEGIARPVTQAGRWSLYPMMALSVVGAVALRRRGVPIYPLLAPIGVVTLSVIVLYMATRFRAPADAAMCLLAAGGVDGLIRWVSGRRHHVAEPSRGVVADAPQPAGQR